jgi:hypothetical protein
MSSGRHSFRLSDLKRVLTAARAARVSVSVEITRDKMIVTTKQDDAPAERQDDAVENWINKHAHQS